MKKPILEESWPDSWKYSYPYDQIEIFGEGWRNYGYYYAYQNRRNQTLRLVTDVLKPGARILDVAAAQGNFSLSLAELGYRVTWNDLRADLIGYVKLKHERGEIDFAEGNVFELAIREPFDAVLITEIIEHVAHPDRFLTQIAELVKPGGYIIMTTPNGAYCRNTLPRFSDCPNPEQFEAIQFKPNSDGHIFLLWPDEVKTLAEKAGLVLDQFHLFTTPLTNGHMKLHYFLKILPAGVVYGIENMVNAAPNAIRQRLMVQLAARFIRPQGT